MMGGKYSVSLGLNATSRFYWRAISAYLGSAWLPRRVCKKDGFKDRKKRDMRLK
jgi:hypothetical protein